MDNARGGRRTSADAQSLPLVALVGQVPPPYGGQAVMTQVLADLPMSCARMQLVPVRFARSFAELGSLSVRKILHLLALMVRILRVRADGAETLYYSPAGDGIRPLLRDALLLFVVRRRFRSLVLHMHAGGMANALERMPRLMRRLVIASMRAPDLCIVLNEAALLDAEALNPKKVAVIPYGLSVSVWPPSSNEGVPFRLLQVGLITESKGFGLTIGAAAKLHAQGLDIVVDLVGEFASDDYKYKLEEQVSESGLAGRVHFHGPLVGRAKDAVFSVADAFSFPSFFEHESLPLVVIEAMAWNLPCVVTRWRGLPEMVDDGTTGYVVPPHDVDALASRLGCLAGDPALRRRLGDHARDRYENMYSAERFHRDIERALADIVTGS